MKKFYILLLAAISAIAANAQKLPDNIGAGQFSSISPVPGKINTEINNLGLLSITFNLAGKDSKVNTSANVYATLSRDGEVLSNVQACNYKQVSFDSTTFGVWQLSFFLSPTPEVKKPGIYQIRFEPGFFLMGEEQTPSTEILLNYLWPESESIIVPEPGTITSFKDITITYPGVSSIQYNEEKKLEVYNIYGADGDDEENATTVVPTVNIEGNVLSLVLPKEINTHGSWVVISEDDAFTLTYENGETKVTGIYFIYIIPNFGSGKPQIIPEEGEIESFPGVITLVLPKNTSIGFVNSMVGSYIYPIDENGNRGQAIARYKAQKSPDASNEIQLIYLKDNKTPDEGAEIIPAPGKYQLVTGERLYGIKEGSTVNYISSMEFNYTVYVYEEIPTTIVPPTDSKVKSIKKISFRFDDAETVKVQDNGKPSWLKSETTNYLFGASLSKEDNKTVDFTTAVGATIPGEYHFTSAGGQVIVDGIEMVVTADYIIENSETGVGRIENVVILPAIFDIYTPDGVLLKKNADIDYLYSLPKGIYIAGGKKFINK